MGANNYFIFKKSILSISLSFTLIALYFTNKYSVFQNIWKYLFKTQQKQCIKDHTKGIFELDELLIFTCEKCILNECDRVDKDSDNNSVKLNQIVKLIDNAETSLEICTYLAIAPIVSDAVIRAFERGVNVRMITVVDTSEIAQYSSFVEKGISIRKSYLKNRIFHNFFIVDYKILITGLMNFSLSTILGTLYNVLITYQTLLVTGFVQEFDIMWEEITDIDTPDVTNKSDVSIDFEILFKSV